MKAINGVMFAIVISLAAPAFSADGSALDSAKLFAAQIQPSRTGVSWAGLEMGMTTQQVNRVLGSPIKLRTVRDEMEGGNRYEGTTVRAGVPVRLVFQPAGKEKRLVGVYLNFASATSGASLLTGGQSQQLSSDLQRRIKGLRKECKECPLQRGSEIISMDADVVGLSLSTGE